MKTIQYTIPDDAYEFLLTAISANHQYPAKVMSNGAEVDNPVSKADFTLAQIKYYLETEIAAYKERLAQAQKDAYIQTLNTQIPQSVGELTVVTP